MHSRVRIVSPEPHVTEHTDHPLQAVKSPSTIEKIKDNCKLNISNILGRLIEFNKAFTNSETILDFEHLRYTWTIINANAWKID